MIKKRKEEKSTETSEMVPGNLLKHFKLFLETFLSASQEANNSTN